MSTPKIIQFQEYKIENIGTTTVLLDDGTMWSRQWGKNGWYKLSVPPVCIPSAPSTNLPEPQEDGIPPAPGEDCAMPHAECFCPHCQYWEKKLKKD